MLIQSIFDHLQQNTHSFFGKLASAASLDGYNLRSLTLIPPPRSTNQIVQNPPAAFITSTSRMNRLLSTIQAMSLGLNESFISYSLCSFLISDESNCGAESFPKRTGTVPANSEERRSGKKNG
jgi:hypothetical protein